jgi:hypothetical protein
MLWAVLMIEPHRLYRHLREHLILICVLLFCYLGSELFYQGQRTSTFLESALAFFRLASIFIAVPAFARVVAKARDMQEGVVVSVALFSAYLLYIYLSSDRMVYGEDHTQEIDAAVGNLTITAMSTWLGPALACVACALFGRPLPLQACSVRFLASSWQLPRFRLLCGSVPAEPRLPRWREWELSPC